MNAGSNATITIDATAPGAAGNMANTAVVDPNNTIPESNELNNTSATVSTSVTTGPAPQGITITKTDSPDPVTPGAILSYTIVIKNIATSRADDVVMVDGTQGLEAASITASQTVVNGTVGTTGGCVVNAPQVQCSIRSLNAGGTLTVSLKGQVIASAGSTILNTATGTANIKNVGVSATATALTTVKPAVDLTITKSDAPDPVCAASWPQPADRLANPPQGKLAGSGSIPTLLGTPVCQGGLTYTFVVGNSGIQNATGVVVRDPLPAGLIFDSYSTDAGFVCAVDASNVVTCSGGTILAESIRNITFMVAAPPTVGVISNTVTVDPNNAIYEADETNNTFTQGTTVATGIDLVIDKRDSPSDPPGAQIVPGGFDPIATNGTETYVLTVDNVGTQDVTGIKVVDTLPSGTRFISVSGDRGFTCASDGAATGGVVTCVGGHLLGTESEFYLAPGASGPAPGDDFATIKIKVFAQPNVGTMHNEARVDPDNTIAETNELNNLATQDTTVTNGGALLSAFNELSIVKTQTIPGAAQPVATNGTLKYSLTVTNDATDPARNIHVRDVVPAGSRFISAVDTVPGPDAFNCTFAVPNIDCTGGTLDGTLDLLVAPMGQSRTIDVTLFAPNTPGDYSNQAIVDPEGAIPEGNEFNNNSIIVTQVRTVGSGGKNAFNELTITKTQDDPASNTVSTSSVVTYKIVIANTGSDPAFNVKFSDTLPAGFVFMSAVDQSAMPDPQAFVCDTTADAGNTINCSGATLSGTVIASSGAPTSRTVLVKAKSSSAPGNYVNTAIVDPNNTIPEGDETNNQSQAPTKVVVGAGYIDLQITKTGPAKVVPGGLISYALNVTNLGTDPAFNVKVRDDLPAGTTFVSAADSTPLIPGAFSCSQAGGSVTCSGGTLDGTLDLIPAPDVPTTRVITVKVLAPPDIQSIALDPGNISVTITNQAFIDPDNAIAESNETNNSSQWPTTVRSKINLRVTKDGPTEATQNQEADYVIKVYNEDADGNGATATGVEVVDNLPVGLIPLYIKTEPANATNFQCQVQENPVNRVYCFGDMGPEGYDPPAPSPTPPDTHIVTITVHVFVTANGGTLDNEACVDPNRTISEQNETDNCVHKITTVVPPAPDLMINKTADASVATPGQQLTYTINVSNVGTADTTDTITVVDTLPNPAAVTVSGATTGSSWPCAITPTTVTCTGTGGLTQGQSEAITIVTTVNADVTHGFANKASVNVVTGETNPANNGPAIASTSVGGTGIDLIVSTIADTPDPVNVGNALKYVFTVTNAGTATAGTVGDPAQVKIILPPTGLSLGTTTAAGTNGFNCELPSGNVITCNGEFLGGGSTVITVNTSVVTGAPQDLTLVAIADPTDKFVEADELNNYKSETTTVTGALCSPNCIDLVAAQMLGTPDPVKTGTTETFTGQLVNVGDLTTVNGSGDHVTVDLIMLYDFLGPVNVTAPSGWTCTSVVSVPGAEWQKCTGNLAAGAGAVFNMSATAGASGGTIFGYIDGTLSGALVAEFTTSNNTATYTSNIVP